MAMTLAVDTNRDTGFANSITEVVTLLESAERIVVPFITIAELRAGFAMGSKGKTHARVLATLYARGAYFEHLP